MKVTTKPLPVKVQKKIQHTLIQRHVCYECDTKCKKGEHARRNGRVPGDKQ